MEFMEFTSMVIGREGIETKRHNSDGEVTERKMRLHPAEAMIRWEEMHFHNDVALDEVIRAANKGDKHAAVRKICALDRVRTGDPMSCGGTYPEGYFVELAEYLEEGELEQFL